MRYFKYKNTNKNINNALKEQYKTLTKDEKRIFRKEKCWRIFSTIVTLIIYSSCIIAGLFLLKTIPLPYTCFLKFLISEEGQSSYDFMNGLAINKNSLIKSMENVV